MSRSLVVVALVGGLVACATAGEPGNPDAGTVADARARAADAAPADADPCEGAAPTSFYRDNDGDGFGDPAAVTLACVAPAGHVADDTDCDDTTAFRNPGRVELCDGLDNDCDVATADVCPAECVLQLNGPAIYMFCNGQTTWPDARDVCISQGMRLARVDDATEDNWLRTTGDAVLGSDQQIWLGAHDLNVEGQWVWTDGSQFWGGDANGSAIGGSYAHWDNDEPNDAGGAEDCAALKTNGQWNDLPCSETREYACERY